MVPALEKIGMLTALDETAMVNYVVAYDRFRQAQEVIQDHGSTTHTRGGRPAPPPDRPGAGHRRACSAPEPPPPEGPSVGGPPVFQSQAASAGKCDSPICSWCFRWWTLQTGGESTEILPDPAPEGPGAAPEGRAKPGGRDLLRVLGSALAGTHDLLAIPAYLC